MYDELIDMEDAIKIVGPIAAKVGLTEDDVRIVLNYIDEMRNRGISGADAGHLLRKYLKDCKDV